MKYFYYTSKHPYMHGWIVTDTKEKCSDLCGHGWKGFVNAIRVYCWYLGMSPRKAFNLFKRKKDKWTPMDPY